MNYPLISEYIEAIRSAEECLTREQEEREAKYQEITDTLKQSYSPYLVSTKYLDKELLVDTTQSDTTEYKKCIN